MNELDINVASDVDEDDMSIRVIVTISNFDEDSIKDCPLEWYADHLADYINDKIEELK